MEGWAGGTEAAHRSDQLSLCASGRAGHRERRRAREQTRPTRAPTFAGLRSRLRPAGPSVEKVCEEGGRSPPDSPDLLAGSLGGTCLWSLERLPQKSQC